MMIGATRFEDEENESSPQNIHNDPEFAGKGLYTGIIDGGVTTISDKTKTNERIEVYCETKGENDLGELVGIAAAYNWNNLFS